MARIGNREARRIDAGSVPVTARVPCIQNWWSAKLQPACRRPPRDADHPLSSPTWRTALLEHRMPLLFARNLTKTFQSGGHPLTVLDDVSLEVNEGESVAVVGPSGSGKTTLLGLCAGLDRPTSGTVSLAGADLGSMSEDERTAVRGRNIGFVFQGFRLLPTLTALENVTVPLELRGEGGKQAAEAAGSLLDRVGLGDRLDHYPAQLSGGEQQRVAIARAFVHRPRLLFADEPTGNLDGETSARVQDLLFDLNHEAGTALVVVTHDTDLAGRCQTIVRLRGGRRLSD